MRYIIYVFRTNVNYMGQAEAIIAMLINYCKGLKISFDLEDCDKILRIEHPGVLASEIIHLVRKQGFDCEELID